MRQKAIKDQYTLVGVDGNAYSVMSYVEEALKESNHEDLVDQYYKEATQGDYGRLLAISHKYLRVANGHPFSKL